MISPPLSDLKKRVVELEAAHDVLYPTWFLLLERSRGNIALAGQYALEDKIIDVEPKQVRFTAMWMVRRLGLVDVAREFRGGKRKLTGTRK